MSIVFLTNSLLTTVQDLGRNSFRRFGINPNGAMDKTSTRLINILLGNDENESVLEMHFPAPKILFEANAVIALGGADFGAKLNEKEIENWRPVFVEKGSILNFTKKTFGSRAYLSIKDGFKIEQWLGSASTNLKAKVGGYEGRSLHKDDRLFLKQTASYEGRKTNFKISKSLLPLYSSYPTVRVVAGAEFERLSADSKKKFQSQNFTIRNESDRMGFRLNSENLNLREKLELISSAVGFGTIQLLPDGQLIILMADHQTTGGYPRIAHIITCDLPLVAQLGANDKLNFKVVTIEEAENLTLAFEKDLNLLKTACRFLC
jgi:antagonist of KipI